MDFDFVRFKARIFRTISYNVILFGAEISASGTVSVQMLKRNSVPFIVAFGAQGDIDCVAVALQALHIIVPIDNTADIDVNSVALFAVHAAAEMQEASEVSVNAFSLPSLPAEASLEDIYSIQVQALTCAAAPMSVATTGIASLIANVVSSAETIGIAIDLASILSVEAAMATLEHTQITIALDGSLQGDMVLRAAEIIETSAAESNYLDLAIGVIVSENPAVIVTNITNYALLAAAVDMYAAEGVQANIQASGVLDIIFGMICRMRLSDYDANAIEDLDANSLQAIAYTEI